MTPKFTNSDAFAESVSGFRFPVPGRVRAGNRQPATILAVTLFAGLFAVAAYADNSATAPKLPGRVAFEQKLNAQVPLDLMFRDESGRVVRLRQLFRGKPVLLNFMYYRCPMLCSLAMDGVSRSLSDLKFDIGNQFDVITVSIDPRDMPEHAAQEKDRYVRRYGRLSSGPWWHFLTGDDTTIHRLTDAVGFEYAYDPQRDQFAHATGILVLTPEGRVSRYLYGIEYKPRDVDLALVDASHRTIGTLTDSILLLCYHYDPTTGRYTQAAMNFVRAGGIVTVLGLAGFIGVMLRREHRGNKE